MGILLLKLFVGERFEYSVLGVVEQTAPAKSLIFAERDYRPQRLRRCSQWLDPSWHRLLRNSAHLCTSIAVTGTHEGSEISVSSCTG